MKRNPVRTAAALAAAAVIGATVPATLVTLTAGEASASTAACADGGAFAGFCGTQQSAAAAPLAWDVYQATPKVNAKVWAYKPGSTSAYAAEDFIWLRYQGGATDVAIYAPGGVPATVGGSNLCVSEPDVHAGLVLRDCNGSKFQQFTAATATASGYYTWANAQFGDIVDGDAGQLVGVTAPATLTAGDQWEFTS